MVFINKGIHIQWYSYTKVFINKGIHIQWYSYTKVFINKGIHIQWYSYKVDFKIEWFLWLRFEIQIN